MDVQPFGPTRSSPHGYRLSRGKQAVCSIRQEEMSRDAA